MLWGNDERTGKGESSVRRRLWAGATSWDVWYGVGGLGWLI
jgi:hypothetical protein